MGSPLQKPTDLRMPRSKGIVIGFWIVTALFCLQMSFTAYAQLRLPQVADHVVDLGPHAGTLGVRIVYEGSYAGHLFNRGNIKV